MLIDRERIAALIPHSGGMCLLDGASDWDGERIVCRASSHLDPANPLRREGRLGAACALEYAAQAMALHGALMAGEGRRSRGGLLASARELELFRERLDDIEGALTIEACRVMGEANRVIYEFSVRAGDYPVARGRAAVVLEA